jgi:hypothetical protein
MSIDVDELKAKALAREAARDERLEVRLEGQRHQGRPEDFVWDRHQKQFWDLRVDALVAPEALDAYIPKARWRVEVDEGDGDEQPEAKKGAGRPKKRKEKLIPPSKDIMRIENDQTVENSTWWPGRPRFIANSYVDGKGSLEAQDYRLLNLYRPPEFLDGVPEEAAPWVEHVKRLWPDEAEHNYFFDYMAQMIVQPDVKCNAAIVLSGVQGAGKDAALFPLKAIVGQRNVSSIEPDDLFLEGQTAWVQSVMLIVNEMRPSNNDHRASDMYNRMKPLIAAPPDTLQVKEKYEKARSIPNLLRVIITTNDYKEMYIPQADRRMFIMHTRLKSEWHKHADLPDYFKELWTWLRKPESAGHVAAWLRARDLSAFDPGQPPPKTRGWTDVVQGWDESEDAVGEVLDNMGNPPVVFAGELIANAFDKAREVEMATKGPRKLMLRMARSGYEQQRSPTGDRWTFRAENGGKYQSKSVFVRPDALPTWEETLSAIKARGQALAHENGAGHGESTTKAF